jgi:hypothetical protein
LVQEEKWKRVVAGVGFEAGTASGPLPLAAGEKCQPGIITLRVAAGRK